MKEIEETLLAAGFTAEYIRILEETIVNNLFTNCTNQVQNYPLQ